MLDFCISEVFMDKYIKYEKRIVLYLDILGFKSAIDKSIEDYGILKSIHKVLNNIYSDRVKNYHGPLEGASYGMHVSVFSDNIVMSIPYETENFFYDFIRSTYWLVNEILWDGFLARGAITIGDLYHDDKIIFGPALNEAYQMESELSIYPRVIISKQIFMVGMENISKIKVEEVVKSFEQILPVDNDGFYFLNYFTKSHEFYDTEVYLDFLIKIKRLIVEGLKNDSLKARPKYEWLKRQYNKLYDEGIDARAPGRIIG